ncbi:MAG: nucleotidyltransferase domain-containing protein [Synergistaceae bacterium]|nr:nucleotidyltransferase domain-containing protein [Synergistaceae bacterium]
MNLSVRVLNEIRTFAKKHGVLKVILFGSRASGANSERSDVDIAVSGGDFSGFYWDIQEKIHSLLIFDVINLSGAVSDKLKEEISKGGTIIYEET